MAAGGGETEFERLLSEPVVTSEDAQAALNRYAISQMENAMGYSSAAEFGEIVRGGLNTNIMRLKSYIEHEPKIHEMTRQEKIDFFNSIKPLSRDFEAGFNNYVLAGRDIIDLSRNEQEEMADVVINELVDFSKPTVSIPILIEAMEYNMPNPRGHVMLLTRRGNDIELFDPSNIPPMYYKDRFRNSFLEFINYLKYSAESRGGHFIRNTEGINPYGFCDSISCTRALYKDMPLHEFMGRFTAHGNPELSHDILLSEYQRTGLPKTLLVKSIKTYEPIVAKREQSEMAYEERLSRALQPAFKKEKIKLKLEDLFRRRLE